MCFLSVGRDHFSNFEKIEVLPDALGFGCMSRIRI